MKDAFGFAARAPLFGREEMIDLVKALRNRATWETATGITEPHQHIDWMAADEIERLREENARLRRLLVEAQDYIDDVYDPLYISIGQELESLNIAAAIQEGGKNDGTRN